MARFNDKKKRTWKIDLDAYVLKEVRSRTSIDLGDLSADGWAQLENDIDLVDVLLVLTEDQREEREVKPREFAKTVRGPVLDHARAAIQEAAADFFPPERWSGMQSRLEARKVAVEAMAAMPKEAMPLMAAFLKLDPETQSQVIQAEIAGKNIARPTLAALKSFGGSGSTPSKPASDSPAKSA